MDFPIRLNKALTHLRLCSRREADQWISAGRVKINGHIAQLGQALEIHDLLEVDDQPITTTQPQTIKVWAYHKPAYVECTLNPNVDANLLSKVPLKERFINIGRLDRESEGLLLLTNYPSLNHLVSHVRFQHHKTYIVWTQRQLKPDQLQSLETGVLIEGQRTLPCKIRPLNQQQAHEFAQQSISGPAHSVAYEVTLTEGKNRQLRKMFGLMGLNIKRLLRTQVMHVQLGNLKSGQSRELEGQELEVFLKLKEKHQEEHSEYDD